MEELSLTRQHLYELMVSFGHDNFCCPMKMVCKGSSMSPFIKDNSIATLQPVSDSTMLATGDVVATAFHDTKQVFFHRIIAASSHGFLVKGDNNKTADGWFRKEDILAIVEAVKDANGSSFTLNRWCAQLVALCSRTNILQYILLPGWRKGKLIKAAWQRTLHALLPIIISGRKNRV